MLFGVVFHSVSPRLACFATSMHAYGSVLVGSVFTFLGLSSQCVVDFRLNSQGVSWGCLLLAGADLGQALVAAVGFQGSGLGFGVQGYGSFSGFKLQIHCGK